MIDNRSAVEQFEELIESVKLIKGKEYAESLKIVFSVSNILAIHARVIKGLAIKHEGSNDAQATLEALRDITMSDLLIVTLRLLLTMPKFQGKESQLITDFTKDLEMLMKKQAEI